MSVVLSLRHVIRTATLDIYAQLIRRIESITWIISVPCHCSSPYPLLWGTQAIAMNALRSCSSSSLLVAYQRPNLHAATKCLSLVQNQRASVTQIVSPQQFQSITNPDPNQYTPAKSWDGLEWVGGAEWRYKNHATDKFHHTRYAHQAIMLSC